MTPYQLAREVYKQEPCKRTFVQDLELHFNHGYVIATPQVFVMGRQVQSGAKPSLILNPKCEFTDQESDCWHIYLFAGDLLKAFDFLPREHPWVSFERKNELRFQKLIDIRRLAEVRKTP